MGILDELYYGNIDPHTRRVQPGSQLGNPVMLPSPVNGGMWYPDAINRLHQKILKSAGLEHIRLHDLRHTYAVNALRAGDDIKTVQENLGHATASFTLSTYAHSTPGMKQESANRMENYIKSLRAGG